MVRSDPHLFLMDENDFILADRIGVIQSTNQKFDLLNNSYLSFSGGKDSTILHYLIDIALPNNKIPRVYIDTGIEYLALRSFVYDFLKNDDRFIIIKPNKPIKRVLDEFGYPFKSKEHSLRVHQFNKGSNAPFIQKYLDLSRQFSCPKILLYQFAQRGKYHYSNLCCYKLKKEPVHNWQIVSGKSITMTGMRNGEGGNRTHLGCAIFSKDGSLKHFHPLVKVSEEWENWFIQKFSIRLCDLYYPPFNFKRTGCKGCPFSLDLQDQLSVMSLYLPAERNQCEIIWKYVYDEYRRIGYRLDKSEQCLLF